VWWVMERKGGCLLVPRSGVGGQAPTPPAASWQMGRIMRKFRPIAPKPAAMAPAPTLTPAAAVAGRGKRKAVGGAGRRGRKPKKAAPTAPARTVGGEKESDKKKSMSSSVEEKAEVPAAPEPSARAAAAHPAASSSWVTVEDVTSTWRDGEAPPAASACGAAPAFVSDRWARVTWANAAFSRAVSPDDTRDGASAVSLAGALPPWGTCAGFTCRVRVRHAAPRRGGGSVVAPCDVWRLDADGCYLWRLDLQAALTLGGFP
jgi:hypothetical protein